MPRHSIMSFRLWMWKAMTGPLVFALLTYIGSIVQAADVQYHQQRSTNYEHLYNDIEDTVSVHEHGDASFSTMDFALVARELNQHNLTALSDKFVSRQDSRQCVEAFAQYYDDIEPFGSGKRASVYRIRRRAATLSGEYRHHILKAIPLQRRDPETWLFQTASGTKPMQEIKNSVALDRALEGSGVRDFFMRTVDWFQCNGRAVRKNDTRRAHRIDTQFIIAEHVLGPNLASTIARLASNDKLTVEFLRSAMFQVLFAMAAAERTSVRFRHFDPHVRNVQLSLKHEDDEEDEKVHGSWEFRIADSERSKRSNVVYRVPREATRAAKMVLIDYGTSVTDDPITGKQRGPWLYRVFRSRLRAMIINARMLVYSVAMSIPRWWYKNWHATDPLTYEQFNALFIRLTGLDQRTAHSRFYMTPVTSLRATFQHGRQVEVRQLGIPDFIWRRPRLWTSWFYASLGRWAQVGAFADVESKGLAVTYDELLHMSFFREAYAVNDEGGGTLDAEFVATLPPMDAAFAEKVYAALALRHGKRKHSGYASRLEVFA